LHVNTPRAQIRDYVISNFLFDTGDVDDDASLIGEGIVDSTGVLELVMFVEETYGIVVADADVTPENFDSIAALTAYVLDKRDDSPAAVAS
jgi:acyl carrier protein